MNGVEEDTFVNIEVVPPEPIREPIVYKVGARIFLEEGAELPIENCFCCGKHAVKTVQKSLRTPLNPLTWIGKRKRVSIGLCRKHGDSKSIALALTWSVFALGLILLAVGLASGTLSMVYPALGAIFLCGVFRAALPVRTPDHSAEPVEIRGFGQEYLESVELEFQAED